jgi:DNA polymerase/3'-5' exonuclease PolX
VEPLSIRSKRQRSKGSSNLPLPNNANLADQFKKLSKLYQASPVLPEDIWKAYSFHKIAGRLLHLDFEIEAHDTIACTKALSAVPGIGHSSVSMILQILQTGTTSRIHCLQKDPMRNAVKSMMAIWGVGRVTVSQKNSKRNVHG